MSISSLRKRSAEHFGTHFHIVVSDKTAAEIARRCDERAITIGQAGREALALWLNRAAKSKATTGSSN